ncbi:hypothetical protein [Hymenobacter persicinus]|uniref:hypothetical protein n=1 Tax=Hymenobacter persicinus TaxID=2025506 RepID=UPI001F5D09EC|nr:hypothetical protein [Hymenobacter persicinus]
MSHPPLDELAKSLTEGAADPEGEVLGTPADLLLPEPIESEICLTKIEKSITNNSESVEELTVPLKVRGKPGRPARQTAAPVTWSVRGVSRETRAVLEQAASRAGKTLGQFLNDDVRQLLEAQEPAPEPQLADLQSQIEYLQQLVENLAAMLGTPNSAPKPPTS